MYKRRKLLAALLCVLALVALMAPLAYKLTQEIAAQKAADDALLAMHIEHAAHLEEEKGEAVLHKALHFIRRKFLL